MPYRSKCVKCQQERAEVVRNAALKWTIYNGQIAVVAPLCMEHGAPLTELVNLVGPQPNMHNTQNPAAAAPKLPKARPLNWVPPAS